MFVNLRRILHGRVPSDILLPVPQSLENQLPGFLCEIVLGVTLHTFLHGRATQYP